MNGQEFQALLPLLILAGGATLMMLQIAFARGLRLTTAFALVILLLAALSVIPAGTDTPLAVTPLLMADRLGLVFCALFCGAGAVTVLLSADYLKHRGDEPEEYFLLLLLSVLGACVLAYSVHVASLLLGLELMSIALYALIAYPDKSIAPLEASIKYLVLSGAASATALFGFALLYAATGSLSFQGIGDQLGLIEGSGAMLFVAAAMIVAGLGFKLSMVPFHLWTPDVYDGAPSPVTGFLASVSKAAVFFVLLRLFLNADLFRYHILVELLGLMAIFSMLAGNFLALLQTNIKRMLAFSSIAHMGYLLVIFMAAVDISNRALATEAAVFYLIAYTVTTLAAFGLLSLISSTGGERERVTLRDVSGLFWRQPLAAGLLLTALLSLAGIPLTAGFIAKFYIVSAAAGGSNWILLASLVIGSGIGIYYYLRVVFCMTQRVEEQDTGPIIPAGVGVRVVSLVLIAGILLLGLLPQPLLEYLRSIL
ncbi:MAG: NADH-quinone oxidoreductase subunit N [Halioglobus sp.]